METEEWERIEELESTRERHEGGDQVREENNNRGGKRSLSSSIRVVIGELVPVPRKDLLLTTTVF